MKGDGGVGSGEPFKMSVANSKANLAKEKEEDGEGIKVVVVLFQGGVGRVNSLVCLGLLACSSCYYVMLARGGRKYVLLSFFL